MNTEHLSPADRDLLAKAKAALERGTHQRVWPKDIIDLITRLGEARAALAELRTQHEHAMQSLMLGDDEVRKELFRQRKTHD